MHFKKKFLLLVIYSITTDILKVTPTKICTDAITRLAQFVRNLGKFVIFMLRHVTLIHREHEEFVRRKNASYCESQAIVNLKVNDRCLRPSILDYCKI